MKKLIRDGDLTHIIDSKFNTEEWYEYDEWGEHIFNIHRTMR